MTTCQKGYIIPNFIIVKSSWRWLRLGGYGWGRGTYQSRVWFCWQGGYIPIKSLVLLAGGVHTNQESGSVGSVFLYCTLCSNASHSKNNLHQQNDDQESHVLRISIIWLLWLPWGCTTWLPWGYNMVTMRLQYGYHEITTWLPWCNVTTWLPWGYYMVRSWGYYMVTMRLLWLPWCYYMVTMMLLHG